MNASPLILLLIVLAVLATSFYFLVEGEGGFKELPRLLERARGSGPAKTDVPPEYYSGTSRFSRGECVTDSDCVATGCSGEVCSSDPDVFSTCEWREDFPSALGLGCGCVAGVCGWQ